MTATGANVWNANEDYFAKQFKHLERSYPDGYLFAPKYKAEGDVLKEQLWHLFQIFGSSMKMGFEVPFKDCVMTINGDAE